MEDIRSGYRILVTEPEGKKKTGGPSHKWEDNIRTEGTGCESVNWTQLAQDRGEWWDLVNTVMNLWVFIKVGEFLE
jgi:hypothetical protein